MPPASKHHFLALAAACGSWHSVVWCLLALRVSKSTPIPSWPCCWRCRKPFLHKVLPFQIKNPAQSPARGAGSLSAPSSPEFKRGLKECRAFPAPITLNYSDTAMHPPAGSRACFPPSLPSALCTFQPLFTLSPSDSALHVLSASSGLNARQLSFAPGQGTVSGTRGHKILSAGVKQEAWKRLGEKRQFSPCCPPTWPSGAKRI